MNNRITLNFREFGQSSDPKVVGIRDGGGQIIFDDLFFHSHPHFTSVFFPDVLMDKDWWKKWAKWEEYGSKLLHIKLAKTAILTDYIGASGLFRCFFVNSKLKEILQTANLPNHNFFEITFIQGGKIVDGYWWFCFDYETGENTVDFSVNIQSYQDYLNVFYETGRAVKVTELVFNSNFNSELDIFGTQFLTNQVYISENLHKKLQEQNITGYTASYPTFGLDLVVL